jgi:hypothetical protein
MDVACSCGDRASRLYVAIYTVVNIRRSASVSDVIASIGTSCGVLFDSITRGQLENIYCINAPTSAAARKMTSVTVATVVNDAALLQSGVGRVGGRGDRLTAASPRLSQPIR